MSVSEWVPIASVAATAAVGLGVPVVAARFDRDKILANAEQDRLNELRTVIDEAGTAITAAVYALDNAIEEAAKPTPLGPDDVPIDRPEQARDTYTDSLKALWTYENRLAVRVRPDDEIYFHYGEAVAALQKAVFVLSEAAAGEPFDRERRHEAIRHRGDAVQQQTRFHQAAAARMGISAPAQRRRRLIGRSDAA